MEFNTENMQTLGRFFETNDVPVTSQAILYVIDDVYYRIDEDGCWFFAGDPCERGWTRCKLPTILQSAS